MKITICGSMLHAPEMLTAAKILEQQGYEVECPNLKEGEYVDGVRKTHSDSDKRRFIDEHFAKIDTSDAILIINKV